MKQKRNTSGITSVSLTPTLLKLIDSKVESGFYTSTSEVIRAALRAFFIIDDKRQEENVTGALEMVDFGLELKKSKIKAKYPRLSEDEILEKLREEMSKRPSGSHEIPASKNRLKRLLENESR